jgi:hypothetical protein
VVLLLKRWLLGTHLGDVSHENLNYYLDEFTFRFNRRTSKHRCKLFFRLLKNAMVVELVTFEKLLKQANDQKARNPKI